MLDNTAVTIILVEDDPGHALLIERNLRRAHIANPIRVLRDGQEAVDALCPEPAGAAEPQSTPLLVLLDLNLPGLTGYQVLARLKAQERTKHIPVIILTSTDEPQDIERCYALGCNIFITKPVEYTQFMDAIRQLGLFLAVIKIPQGG